MLVNKLPTKITDKAATAIREGEDYDNIKKIVLTQYGRSLRTIGAQMFPKRRAHIRDRKKLAQFVHDEVTRVPMLCTTAEQWAAFVTQAYYTSIVSGSETPHVYTHTLERS